MSQLMLQLLTQPELRDHASADEFLPELSHLMIPWS